MSRRLNLTRRRPGVRILVTISALTSLVVEAAEKYGPTVVVLAPPDRMFAFSGSHGSF